MSKSCCDEMFEEGRKEADEAARAAITSLQAEVARLREVLANAKPYVWAAVMNDGGIENCQIEYRVDYESIQAALGGDDA